MTRSDQERVADVLGGVGRLQEVRDGGRAAFDREWIVRSAACYELLVIGEALNALSDEFMLGHVGLPVRAAKDLRNVLAHEYFRTDDDILWNTIRTDIPAIAATLRRRRPRSSPGASLDL